MIESRSSQVAILYWGTRGGPIRQLSNLIETSVDEQLDIHWFLSDKIQGLTKLSEITENRMHVSRLPKSKIGLVFRILIRRKTANEAIKIMKLEGITRVFFLLPHPWDINLAKKIFKDSQIDVVRAVHDINRHPGDIWPTKRAIRKTLKFAHRYVAFSSYIATALKDYGKPVELTAIQETPVKVKTEMRDGSILFIGRIRKYKGLDLLRDAWNLLDHRGKKLTIAGSGSGIPFTEKSDLRIINSWLSDDEINDLIDSHQVIVLPYVEASQSGIIPIAHAHGKPVVVTPVGGLINQVIPNVNGIIANEVSAKALAIAIDSALEKKWDIRSSNVELSRFLRFLVNYK